jgi:hypothetical protein
MEECVDINREPEDKRTLSEAPSFRSYFTEDGDFSEYSLGFPGSPKITELPGTWPRLMKQRTRYCNRHGTNFISAFPSPGSLRDFPKFAAPWQSWLELVLGLGLENETIANLAHLSYSVTNAIYRMIRMSEEMGGHALGTKIGRTQVTPAPPTASGKTGPGLEVAYMARGTRCYRNLS